jgi:hypothetical protein
LGSGWKEGEYRIVSGVTGEQWARGGKVSDFDTARVGTGRGEMIGGRDQGQIRLAGSVPMKVNLRDRLERKEGQPFAKTVILCE